MVAAAALAVVVTDLKEAVASIEFVTGGVPKGRRLFVGLVNASYGSMATTIIVLLTMEAASVIVLLGAQELADLQQSIQTQTAWDEEPED